MTGPARSVSPSAATHSHSRPGRPQPAACWGPSWAVHAVQFGGRSTRGRISRPGPAAMLASMPHQAALGPAAAAAVISLSVKSAGSDSKVHAADQDEGHQELPVKGGGPTKNLHPDERSV